MELGSRFQDALVYAGELHADQKRKGTGIPYITHLLSVAALVIEDGGDEDEAIAALLHDAVEDQGGRATLRAIRIRFGDRVADIVQGCTDTDQTPKPPWRRRKEDYLAHLPHASPEVRRVSLADKLHNSRSLLRDLLAGDCVWERFRGGKDGTLWYYRSLLSVFRATSNSPMVQEFTWVVERIEALTNDHVDECADDV